MMRMLKPCALIVGILAGRSRRNTHLILVQMAVSYSISMRFRNEYNLIKGIWLAVVSREASAASNAKLGFDPA
jgi:hypothetical protein